MTKSTNAAATVVRPFTAADVPAMVAMTMVWDATTCFPEIVMDRESMEFGFQRICAARESSLDFQFRNSLLVAENGGRLVGLLMCERHDLWFTQGPLRIAREIIFPIVHDAPADTSAKLLERTIDWAFGDRQTINFALGNLVSLPRYAAAERWLRSKGFEPAEQTSRVDRKSWRRSNIKGV